jgi:hypothetical protein
LLEKFKPEMVTETPPEFGKLKVDPNPNTKDATGESNVKSESPVPTMPEMVVLISSP